MGNKSDNSRVRIIFLISWGAMVFFIIIKYTLRLETEVTGNLSFESLIKIMIGLLFVISSFLVYQLYKKS